MKPGEEPTATRMPFRRLVGAYGPYRGQLDVLGRSWHSLPIDDVASDLSIVQTLVIVAQRTMDHIMALRNPRPAERKRFCYS